MNEIEPPPVCVARSLLKAGWYVTICGVSQEMDVVFCQMINGIVELCHVLQNQDSESMAHECLSDNKIWSRTEWLQDMLAGSVFDHIKRDTDSSLTLDGVRGGPEGMYNEGEQQELMAVVRSQDDNIDVEFIVPRHMDAAVAQKALDDYCTVLKRFSKESDRLILQLK